MKICNNCKKEFEDEKIFCDTCGDELKLKKETEIIVKPVECAGFCIYCGGEIEQSASYCKKCGRSAVNEGKKHCIQCGTELLEEQKFCAKCGSKTSIVVFPKELDGVADKVKKINKKRIIKIVIAACALIMVVFLGIKVVPELIVTTDEYLQQANYEEAYKNAKADEKNMILFENLVASICIEAKDALKDEDSFKLRDIWYVESENKLVLQIQGKNSYGGNTSSYWYYTFDEDDNKYVLWTTVSDFDEEEIYSWDDTSDIIEKMLDNAAKKKVKEIINEKENERDSVIVDRINQLHKNDLLKDIKIMEETMEMFYPTGNDTV